jgi:hypothetical protein
MPATIKFCRTCRKKTNISFRRGRNVDIIHHILWDLFNLSIFFALYGVKHYTAFIKSCSSTLLHKQLQSALEPFLYFIRLLHKMGQLQVANNNQSTESIYSDHFKTLTRSAFGHHKFRPVIMQCDTSLPPCVYTKYRI